MYGQRMERPAEPAGQVRAAQDSARSHAHHQRPVPGTPVIQAQMRAKAHVVVLFGILPVDSILHLVPDRCPQGEV